MLGKAGLLLGFERGSPGRFGGWNRDDEDALGGAIFTGGGGASLEGAG